MLKVRNKLTVIACVRVCVYLLILQHPLAGIMCRCLRDGMGGCLVILQLAYTFSTGAGSLQYMFPVSPLIIFATYNVVYSLRL